MNRHAKMQAQKAMAPTTATLNNGILQRKCACGQHSGNGGECEACHQKRMNLQRQAASPAAPDVAPPIVHEVLRSPGQPLDAAARDVIEPRFGHDFSDVRVHADARAAESAQTVNALAYTVGRDVVFGAGQYAPATGSGQRLLAHELTHVLQQRAGTGAAGAGAMTIDPDLGLEAEAEAVGNAVDSQFAIRGSSMASAALQRQPAGGGGKAPYITEVRVNQNTKQMVTATFSDGHAESDRCSTGKGHCCFDATAGTAEGGACSAARSTQVGNNCTPIGSFTVTAKLPQTSSGVKLWTQFHDAKSVALHEYSPVDGTPLSHGCVRLHEPMAQTIYNGARVGLTRVVVEGLARPKCEDTALQTEWSHDFATAGTPPPDGQTNAAAQERRHIQGTRKEMKSALGVDDAGLDAELAAVAAGAPIVSKIPRCVPALTREEQEVQSAKSAGFLTSNANTTTAAFTAKLNKTITAAAAEKVVRAAGEQLWQSATAAARAGGAGTDDRQLYWTRLMMTTALRQWNPSWVPNADALRRLHAQLLLLFEQTSRGITTTAFQTEHPEFKRILISGFDPFGFTNPGGDIRQSNLSGAAALALDNEILTQGAISAQVQAVVFPVRYADFNEGIVENHLRPHLAGSQPPHLVMSISQGSKRFEFEESAGRRRSTDTFEDNLGQLSGGSPANPIQPPGLAKGPEFLSHSVPPTMLKGMRGAVGRTSAIQQETEVIDLPSGATKPRTLPAGPGAKPGLAVEGSGGGFLSNEIFYRNSLLRTQTGSSVPMIHLHTPMLAPGASDTTRNTLIAKIREILQAALPHL